MTRTAQQLETMTPSASMSCETVAQLTKYQQAVKEYANKVDAGLLTLQEAARYISTEL